MFFFILKHSLGQIKHVQALDDIYELPFAFLGLLALANYGLWAKSS